MLWKPEFFWRGRKNRIMEVKTQINFQEENFWGQMFDCDFSSTARAQHGETINLQQYADLISGKQKLLGLWKKCIRQHQAAKDTTHCAKRRDGLPNRAILASSTRFPEEIAFNKTTKFCVYFLKSLVFARAIVNLLQCIFIK